MHHNLLAIQGNQVYITGNTLHVMTGNTLVMLCPHWEHLFLHYSQCIAQDTNVCIFRSQNEVYSTRYCLDHFKGEL